MRLSFHNVNLFLFLILIGKILPAQLIPQTDTIETAHQLAYSKKYLPAIDLLKTYELNHPKEINSVRLHAQILYWMQDYDKALQLCENTLKSNPNQFLKLDYARMLFELYKLKEAKTILTDYTKTDKANVEANNMLGTIAYWNGNPRLAKYYFNTVLKKYPGNEWAFKYMRELKLITAPFIKLQSEYADDTQPLQSIKLGLETGWYSSVWLQPKFNFQLQHAVDSLQTRNFYTFQLANKFVFSKIKTDLTLATGIYKSPSVDNVDWIGGLELTTKLLKNISLSVSAEHKPYLYTLSSLENNTSQNSYTGSISFYKEESWNGRVAYNVQEFTDNNQVNTLSAWLLLPPLKFSKFALSIGYGNNFSDSKENRFTPSIVEVIAGDTIIRGVYNPYFTPQNQEIHSVIGNFTFKPIKSFSITLNGNFGVYAIANNPYLYLDKDSNNDLIISRGFASTKFNPMEITGKLNYHISNQIILDAAYSHNKTLFYTSNTISMTLKYIFIGEQ